MRTVRVTGAGMTAFGKHIERSLRDLTGEAVGAALAEAGRHVEDIQAAFFGNAFAGVTTGQEAVRGQVSLLGSIPRGIPVFNVENACASSASAFYLAWLAVAAGEYDRVLVVGAEKLHHEDRTTAGRALRTAADVEESAQADNYFMGIYAGRAKRYAARTGATPRHFAMVSAKNRAHGSLNPYAQFRSPVTVDDVLESPMIVDPLTRLMCSPIADGAAALVLEASPAGAAPRVLASVVVSGGTEEHLVARAAAAAYERGGVGPQDLDLVELHDGAAPAELEFYEHLGLCEPGGGVELIEHGATALGGRVPVNPSGGLLSRGHPVGATGVAQIAELAWQLRGRAGRRQVEGARVGLAENTGGYVGGDTAAGTITILGG